MPTHAQQHWLGTNDTHGAEESLERPEVSGKSQTHDEGMAWLGLLVGLSSNSGGLSGRLLAWGQMRQLHGVLQDGQH